MISRWAYGTLWSLPLSELCTSVHTVPGEPPTQPARRRGEQEQLKRQADEIWSLISANFTNSIKTSIGKTHSVTPSEILPPLSRSGTDETGSDVILSDPPRLPATWTIKASTSWSSLFGQIRSLGTANLSVGGQNPSLSRDCTRMKNRYNALVSKARVWPTLLRSIEDLMVWWILMRKLWWLVAMLCASQNGHVNNNEGPLTQTRYVMTVSSFIGSFISPR